MPSTGTLMAAEIAEQPIVLSRLLAHTEPVERARHRIEQYAPRFVLFAARGTSDHAALYGKYLVELVRQQPAGLVSPSTLTLYGARPDMAGVLFIAVSQSGASPDLVHSVKVARAGGALTVAITNTPDSALATAAELHLDIGAGPEHAVAATKTYTGQLLTLWQLLAGGNAAALPDAAERTLTHAQDAYAAATALAGHDRIVVTGRGLSYPTAREGALKLMETSYVAALAFSGADLVHGPLAMVDRSTAVIAITTPGPGGDAMAELVGRIEQIGATLVRIGGTGALPVDATDVPPELLAVLEILPVQQLAWKLAVDRGNDPDRPRGLSKVTQTL